MGKWVHRISGVRPDESRAICAHCGPVDVKWNGKRWRCGEQVRESRRIERRDRKRPHGLTASEAAIFKEGKVCELCESTENLKVDHDHKTMKIRGVLCHHCNVAIGHMRDDPERLRRAADYLER